MGLERPDFISAAGQSRSSPDVERDQLISQIGFIHFLLFLLSSFSARPTVRDDGTWITQRTQHEILTLTQSTDQL